MKLGRFPRAAHCAGRVFAVGHGGARKPAAASRPRPALNIPRERRSSSASRNRGRPKATAIVNGEVITQTDIDQRLALLLASTGGRASGRGDRSASAPQVLRNLIDETLQIQAAAAEEIDGRGRRDRPACRAASPQTSSRRPSSCADYLRPIGSSIARCGARSTARSPGSGCSGRRIEPFVSVGDDEVAGGHRPAERVAGHGRISRRRNLPLGRRRRPRRGARQRRRGSSQQLRGGASFVGLCPPIFRSLDRRGRRRSRLGPRRAAARGARRRSCARCRSAAISDPIAVPGGFSIIASSTRARS